MFKHIVIWTLKDQAGGAGKAENAEKLKEKLEALQERIPEAKKIEVGGNMSGSDAAGDLVLYSEFDSLADFQVYQNHPAHTEVLGFIKEIVDQRTVVDYETDR